MPMKGMGPGMMKKMFPSKCKKKGK